MKKNKKTSLNSGIRILWLFGMQIQYISLTWYKKADFKCHSCIDALNYLVPAF